MKIVYGKQLNSEDEKIIGQISSECGILFDTARLLFYREQNTVAKARRFLSPGKIGFNNPFLLSGMNSAVERISLAKLRGESVLVFGDYDADGVCATTILYYCLREYGIKDVRVYVPEREEGYGLNVDTVAQLHTQKNINLLITVDCGISDFDKIKEIKDLGIEVIVTDHHEPPEVLPDCIKINPKLTDQQYPFSGLCGAGVAYKVGVALIGEKADKYLDFVALATVADSMDLVEENRDIVVEGLKLFNDQKTLRLPFKYLLGDNVKNITSQTLAYTIAPRINAGGRMGDANSALNLFISDNVNQVFDLAVKLNSYNLARQVECDSIYNQAKQKIKKFSLEKKDVILVKDKNWSAGFIGIVAAKLVEDYARPVIVFAGHGDYLKGSARSVDNINIHDAITSVKDLLIGYGGHSQAAGVSVSEENFASLDRAINAVVKREYGKCASEQKLLAEWNIDGEISTRFAHEIEALEPFGVGNRRPMFTTKVGKIKSQPLKSGSQHFSFKTEVLEMLDFNGEKHVYPLSLPIEKTVVFELNLSVFKNRETIKGYVRAIQEDYGDFSSLKLHIFANELDKLTVENERVLERIDKIDRSGVGTIFAISDYENIDKFSFIKGLPVYLHEPTTKNCSDCVVVSLSVVPDGFNTVVYLDKPMQAVLTNAESYIYSDECGYKLLDKISVDRTDFAKIFNQLMVLNHKPFSSLVDFVLAYAQEQEEEMFAFALQVFLELNIFCVKNDMLVYNENIKNALTNSKVYSKIVLLKG